MRTGRKASPELKNKPIQLYIIHQTYLTPVLLLAMGFTTTSNCLCCAQPWVAFNHLMWTCPHIAMYFKRITDLLSNLLAIPIPLTPEVCLLGLLDKELWPRYVRTFLKEMLVLMCKQNCTYFNAGTLLNSQISTKSFHMWKFFMNMEGVCWNITSSGMCGGIPPIRYLLTTVVSCFMVNCLLKVFQTIFKDRSAILTSCATVYMKETE